MTLDISTESLRLQIMYYWITRDKKTSSIPIVEMKDNTIHLKLIYKATTFFE